MHEITDWNLTKETAEHNLTEDEIVAAFYTNDKIEKSVVHSHPYHEFVFPVAGSDVLYSASGTLYTVKLHEMIYFPPGNYHAGLFHVTEQSSKRMVVQIADSIWKEAAERIPQFSLAADSRIIYLDEVQVNSLDLYHAFEQLVRQMENARFYKRLLTITKLMEIQLLLINSSAEEKAASKVSNELVAKAIAYLEQHYTDKDLTATKLAQELYVSRAHLSRCFHEYSLDSIHGYLLSLRMQKCRQLLEQGMNVNEAASKSGFSEYTSFLKAFKKLYGITPKAYQKEMR